MPITRYRVDRSDLLVEVNQAWTDFALENGAPQLTPPQVLGRSLWEFLDLETQMIYQAVFRRIRTAGVTATFSLRCDSPTLRRHIQMVLAPAAEESIAIACEVTATSPIRYGEETPLRVGELLRICSWCNRIALSDVEWVDVEQALPRLHALERFPVPSTTHGMCPACAIRIKAEILA